MGTPTTTSQSQFQAQRPRIQYKKIDWSKNEVRFLELQPSVSIREPVVCRMIARSIDDEFDFIAISSLLGDATATDKITINGASVLVPAHISQALRHARVVFSPQARSSGKASVSSGSISHKPSWLQSLIRHFRSRPDPEANVPLRIWIDCLCLNGDDRREREKQRAIMARVYWKAQTVIGWVGLKIEQTDTGIQLIRAFDEAMPETFGDPGDKEAHPENYSPKHVWARPIAHYFDPNTGAALGTADFLNRPFFKRRWIIEEMAFARVATFLIGDAIVSWKQLLRLNIAMEEFKENESEVCPPETRPLIHELPLETVHALLDEFERRKKMERHDSLLKSLAHSTSSKDTMDQW